MSALQKRKAKPADASPVPPWAAAIREAREGLGWSQGYLGGRVGRSQQAVNDWENGVTPVPASLWGSLCRELSIAISKLSTLDEAQTTELVSAAFPEFQREVFLRLHASLKAVWEAGVRVDRPVALSSEELAYASYQAMGRVVLAIDADHASLDASIETAVARQQAIWRPRQS